MWRLALLLALGLTACDGETTLPGAPLGWGPASGTLYEPPAAGGGILGDWFICADASCAELTWQGLRFESDGTWTALATFYLQGDYGPGADYCLSDSTGTYAWDGATLTIRGLAEVGDLGCRVTFEGDVAALNCFTTYLTYLKRVSADRVEPCPVYAGLPAGE